MNHLRLQQPTSFLFGEQVDPLFVGDGISGLTMKDYLRLRIDRNLGIANPQGIARREARWRYEASNAAMFSLMGVEIAELAEASGALSSGSDFRSVVLPEHARDKMIAPAVKESDPREGILLVDAGLNMLGAAFLDPRSLVLHMKKSGLFYQPDYESPVAVGTTVRGFLKRESRELREAMAGSIATLRLRTARNEQIVFAAPIAKTDHKPPVNVLHDGAFADIPEFGAAFKETIAPGIIGNVAVFAPVGNREILRRANRVVAAYSPVVQAA